MVRGIAAASFRQRRRDGHFVNQFLCKQASKQEGTEELDLLVIMDSENVANSMGTAWEAQDLSLLRGETYGFRLEEALLLRRLIQRRGCLVDIARMSAHVGLTWNVYADAVAVAALQLDCTIEPRLSAVRCRSNIFCPTARAAPLMS